MNIQKINEFIYKLQSMAQNENPSVPGPTIGDIVIENNKELKKILKGMVSTRQAKREIKQDIKACIKDSRRYGVNKFLNLVDQNKYLTGLAVRMFVLKDTQNEEIAHKIITEINDSEMFKMKNLYGQVVNYMESGSEGKTGLARLALRVDGVEIASIIDPKVKENVIYEVESSLLKDVEIYRGGYFGEEAPSAGDGGSTAGSETTNTFENTLGEEHADEKSVKNPDTESDVIDLETEDKTYQDFE